MSFLYVLPVFYDYIATVYGCVFNQLKTKISRL